MNQQQFIEIIGEGRHEYQWALRRKYWSESPEAHKIFRKGFVKGKDIMDKCIAYDQEACNQGTVFYINPNQVDDALALINMQDVSAKKQKDVYRNPSAVVDAYKIAMSALNKSFIHTWADIDVDTLDEKIVDRVRSVLNHGYIEIETHGGYHFMVHLATNERSNWYGQIRQMRNEFKGILEIEPKVDREKSFFVPMPYTLQGGKLVTITDVTL